jgi:hypothetical protein
VSDPEKPRSNLRALIVALILVGFVAVRMLEKAAGTSHLP